MRLPDPTRSRAVLIGAARYDSASLPDLPAVANNLTELRNVLTDPGWGGFSPDRCTVLPDPTSLRDVYQAIRRDAMAAEDVLLIYFAGHGLTGLRHHQLYLALSDTHPELLPVTALDYGLLREMLLDSPALNQVVILDCCYSGRAVDDVMAAAEQAVLGQVEIAGAYVLAATSANLIARASPGAPYTAFTGELLNLLRTGVTGGQDLLSLGLIYRQLRQVMAAKGLPVPHQRGTGTADLLALVRNAARNRGARISDRRLFQLGDLRTTCVIVEGDGEHAIAKEDARVLIVPEMVVLPAEMAGWREEIAAEQERRRAAGQSSFWNGPRYAVSGFTVSRSPDTERPEVCLHLKHSDYYSFLAAQQLDRPFADGGTPRSRYLEPYDLLDVPDFMQSSFGVNMLVVTADGAALVSRRSGRVGSTPGGWSVSANEGLSRNLDAEAGGAPDLYEVARRGLSEELGLSPADYGIDLLAFAVDTLRQQWGATFHVRLRRHTAAMLGERLTRGILDGWEHVEHDFVPFEPEQVLVYLLRPDRRAEWAALAPAHLVLSLVHEHGREAVERALARM
jgi:hypothetical protein